MPLPPINLKEINSFPPQFKDWLRQLHLLLGSFAHNDLSNKQGGTSGEFYHLTAAQYANQAHGLVTETAATHTVATTTKFLIANRAGTITVTLPSAASFTGRELILKTIQAQTVISASSDVVPLNGGAAGTAVLAATTGKWAHLVSDGTNWVIMAAN